MGLKNVFGGAVVAAFTATVILAGGFFADSASAATATQTNCQKASGGSGKYVNELCWINFHDLDFTEAQTLEGQNMQYTLPNGGNVFFNVKIDNSNKGTGRGFHEVQVLNPNPNSIFGLGSNYAGLTDEIWVIYSGSGAASMGYSTITLSDFKMDGQSAKDFLVVIADAERTDVGHHRTP